MSRMETLFGIVPKREINTDFLADKKAKVFGAGFGKIQKWKSGLDSKNEHKIDEGFPIMKPGASNLDSERIWTWIATRGA